MTIGVDAGCLGIQDKRLKVGVYQVAFNLLKEISKIDKKNTYLLYSFYPIDREILRNLGKNMKNIVVKPSRGWMKIWLPLQIAKDNIDIFLALGQSIPLKIFVPKKYKIIGFVYDLAYEKYPDFYIGSLNKLRTNTKNLINKSDSIITISQNTKNDIINSFPAVKTKIAVAYPGVEIEKLKQSSQMKNYFLFVGALKRIKNIPTILKAFNFFLEKTKKDYTLVLVGGDKWPDPKIEEVLEELPLSTKEKIVFKGFVQERQLANLYQNSTAFVGPSLYEGFGLPFVEAMVSSVPVISSKKGATSEVVGEAGILVDDPLDYKAVAESMIDLVTNAKLRAKLISEGKKQAAKYNWKSFAQSVYNQIQFYGK